MEKLLLLFLFSIALCVEKCYSSVVERSNQINCEWSEIRGRIDILFVIFIRTRLISISTE